MTFNPNSKGTKIFSGAQKATGKENFLHIQD
jgi:hypothetical protein